MNVDIRIPLAPPLHAPLPPRSAFFDGPAAAVAKFKSSSSNDPDAETILILVCDAAAYSRFE